MRDRQLSGAQVESFRSDGSTLMMRTTPVSVVVRERETKATATHGQLQTWSSSGTVRANAPRGCERRARCAEAERARASPSPPAPTMASRGDATGRSRRSEKLPRAATRASWVLPGPTTTTAEEERARRRQVRLSRFPKNRGGLPNGRALTRGHPDPDLHIRQRRACRLALPVGRSAVARYRAQGPSRSASS